MRAVYNNPKARSVTATLLEACHKDVVDEDAVPRGRGDHVGKRSMVNNLVPVELQ